MDKSLLISIDTYCQIHDLAFDLIISFHDFGLISIVVKNDQSFIESHELSRLEKIISLHNELEINKEGIEVIFSLLEQIGNQQLEITQLKNQVRLTKI